MAINFPSGPSTNQVYTESGKTWRYDGTAWRTQNVTAIVSGGTGLTSITAGNALLSSNSGASGLAYRTLIAGSGISFSFGTNDITLSSTPAGRSETGWWGRCRCADVVAVDLNCLYTESLQSQHRRKASVEVARQL